MSHPLPLALCVFDSSKGHFDRRDIYQRTITDLARNIPLDSFQTRLVHIKVGPGEEAVFEEQRGFYGIYGFEVLRTDGAWSHFADSHQQQYSRDLIKVYGHRAVLDCEYALHLESDWLFDAKDGQLIDRLSEAIAHLSHDHSLVGVRFPRFLNEVDRLNNLLKKHGLPVSTAPDRAPFIRHNDRISLNPSIYRTRDLYLATRLMKGQFAQYGNHVEHQFGELLRWMSDGAMPWAIFDPAVVSVLHIGTKAGEEDVAGNVYERIDS